MYCMFAFDECVLSVNLASFTSHQSSSYSISSFVSSRTPSAPSARPRAISTRARLCVTHDSSLFRYYYTLLLTNQHASLMQSCSHSSCARAIQHASPAPPHLPVINSMYSELSQPSRPPSWRATLAPASFSCFYHVSFLFWFVFTPHITTRAPTQLNMTVCGMLAMHESLFMLKSARLACTSPAIIAKTHNPTLPSPCALIPESLLKIIVWQHAWTCPPAVCNQFPVL
jgi:hypothetical protein